MFSQSMDVDLPNFIGLTQAEIQENIRIQNSFFRRKRNIIQSTRLVSYATSTRVRRRLPTLSA